MSVPEAQDARQKLGRKTGLADAYAAKLAGAQASLTRDPIEADGAAVFLHPGDGALHRRSGLRVVNALGQQGCALAGGVLLEHPI